MPSDFSPDEFAQIVADALAPSVDGSLSYDQANFCLFLLDNNGSNYGRVNLGNYFNDFCNSPDDESRDDVIRAILQAQSLPSIPDTYEEAQGRLYPHIQDLWTVQEMHISIQLGQFGEGNDVLDISFPCAIFGGSYAAVLAYDLPNTRLILNSTHTDSWNVDFEVMFENALTQLAERTHGEFAALDHETAKVYFSLWEDGYDAARILMPEMLAGLPVLGWPVVFLPNANQLIVTGSDDEVGLAVGLSAYENAMEENKPLPPIPIAIVDGEYRRMLLPTDHPLHSAFRRMEALYFDRIYDQQKELLNDTFEYLQDDTFIAKYSAFQSEEGAIFSTSTLTDGVPTLLPKTDTIAFMRVNEEDDSVEQLAVGPWDKVMQICGDLFQQTEHYPPRFIVTEFPTSVQLEMIGNDETYL